MMGRVMDITDAKISEVKVVDRQLIFRVVVDIDDSLVQKDAGEEPFDWRTTPHGRYSASKKGRLNHIAYVRIWKMQNRDAQLAHWAVYRAIKRGELHPKQCEHCGSAPFSRTGRRIVHAHHHLGYKPKNQLVIQWLCPQCHRGADNE